MLKILFGRHEKFTLPLALLLGVLFVTGCGGKFPRVTGKVTFDGKPVPNLKVVFTPIGSIENPVPGPFSTGVTDESGSYSLRTRRKDLGAVAGTHRVGFEWADFNEDHVDDLKELIGSEGAPSKKAKLSEELKAVKDALKSRPKIPKTLEFQFVVPADGTSEADFELFVQESD